jgi:hypothetical protein
MRRCGAVAVAGLALVLAGCAGGDETNGPDGGPSSPSTPSSEPSPGEPSPSETDAPEPTPTVEPADGVELDVDGFRVNGLKGWRITNETPFGDTALGPVGDGRSGGVLLATVSEGQVSIAQAMRTSWSPGPRPEGFEEQPRTVLGGLSAFYYTAVGNKFITEHVLGTSDSGLSIEINIQLPVSMPPTRQKEIVDSIVASYRTPYDD